MTDDDVRINKTYPLLTMLKGLISFCLSGIITGFLSLKTNEGLILLLGVPLGTLLMLFLLRKLNNGRVLSVIILSELGGIAGFIAGFILGELFSGGIAFIISSLGDTSQLKAQIIPNMIVLIVADIIFGIFLAGLFYGRKSILFFALVCGIASIPFGVLLSMPMNTAWIPFDQNLFFSLLSFGTTTGLSMGLYPLRKVRK